jgi:hypothetical protein
VTGKNNQKAILYLGKEVKNTESKKSTKITFFYIISLYEFTIFGVFRKGAPRRRRFICISLLGALQMVRCFSPRLVGSDQKNLGFDLFLEIIVSFFGVFGCDHNFVANEC